MTPDPRRIDVHHHALAASKVLDDETRQRIDRDYALALFPRFAK